MEQRGRRLKKKQQDDIASSSDRRIIGIDGEGEDTPDGGHIYTYLAAVDEKGRVVAEVENRNGLSHEECARMIMSLPEAALKFAFMFSYDTTKIVEQLDPADIYFLMRPKHREQRRCRKCATIFRRSKTCVECGSLEIIKESAPVQHNLRHFDFFNGSLTVSGKKPPKKNGEMPKEDTKTIKIWDCFRFFGCAFLAAIKAWKVGTVEQHERIDRMKALRGSFSTESFEEIKLYCQEECTLLAQMMRKVIDAHVVAGIPLERFDGAGSTASALLRKHDVVRYKGPRLHELDVGLAEGIASAFFGGRFEDSVVGLVEQPIDGYDIASAYPFAQTHLPCLECGRWRQVERCTKEMLAEACFAGNRTAKMLVLGAFRVHPRTLEQRREIAWCPLPFRSEEGSIIYGTNFSGWAWAPELLAALEGWPDLVELTGPAWVYETDCHHEPFQYLPSSYRLRCEWGKEGPGQVMKLGINAGYGKTAQSIGDDPPFQSWCWAGMTTATTRGQLLQAICSAKDRWNVLTLATDGIYAAEELPLREAPRSTGTDDCQKEEERPDGTKYKVFCPLGCWEHKHIEEGVFIAKPGLYYRLKTKLKDVRARGIGRKEFFDARAAIEKGFADWDRLDPKYHVPVKSRRFYGAKHSINGYASCGSCGIKWPGPVEGPTGNGCPRCHTLGTKFETSYVKRTEVQNDGTILDRGRGYGTWGARLVKIAFDPHPKREREGISRTGTFARLTVRDLGGEKSSPYDVLDATTTPEGMLSRAAKEIQLEQPDWDGSVFGG